MPYPRKLKIPERVVFKEHRSGWAYAVGCLQPLITDEAPVLFDTFIEATFGWDLRKSAESGRIPYREPWIGVIHNPPGIPEWHESWSAPQRVFQLPEWRESLPACRGFVVLSRWMEDWVRKRTDLPVVALTHPTENAPVVFSMERFEANPEARVIQVGWWLRVLHSIHFLPLKRRRKARLTPVGPERERQFDQRFQWEKDAFRLPDDLPGGVDIIPYLDHAGYDRLLSENIVFLHLFDTVANNVIVECIVRNTPVLVNRLPSAVEYLGERYPFYFETLEEAAAKAEDDGLVRETHEYLKALPKERFTGDFFLKDLAESDFYRGL